MHFQVIKDEYYQNIISHLKSIVPEFEIIFDDDDGVYPTLSDFGKFLLSNIDNEIILSKCMRFIDDAIENGKHQTEDVIVLQIFQPAYRDGVAVAKMKQKLGSKASFIFDKFLRL